MYSGGVEEIPFRTVAELMTPAITDAESARRAVEPYRNMTPSERLQAQSVLNARLDVLLAGRMPERDDGEPPFWMLWQDPLGARRRWEARHDNPVLDGMGTPAEDLGNSG